MGFSDFLLGHRKGLSNCPDCHGVDFLVVEKVVGVWKKLYLCRRVCEDDGCGAF